MAILFLSHSTKNKAAALQIDGALTKAGHTVFVDSDHEDGIAPGTAWRQELFSAVSACNAVVFLNSPESQASQWCFSELTLAAEHNKWIYAVNLTAEVGPHPLLADKQGIRLETSFEDSLSWLASTLTKDFAGRNATTRWDATRDPYPGLRSFEAADAAVFFGRDAAVNEVMKRIDDLSMSMDGNVIALIGPSGSGKSSLVKAGVVPRLIDRNELVIVGPFEPGNFPTDRLVAALRAANTESMATLDAATLQTDGLARVVSRLLDGKADRRRALIVIDQVEYLGGVEEPERSTFLSLVDAALAPGSRITLLLVIRQDRLEEVQRLAPLGRRITSTLAVLPIDVDGLKLAIEEPAAAARMTVDRDLTDKAIRDATDGGGTDAGRALPLVAETLRAVYELAKTAGRRTMTADDYDAVGGVRGSMQRYAEQAEAQLGANTGALDELLPRFVTLEDDSRPAIGRPVALASLTAEQRAVVGRLQDVRLVTGDGESVRIVHDRLIEAWPRLAKAVQGRRKELLFRAQLERQAKEWAKGDGSEFLLGTESTEEAETLVKSDSQGVSSAVVTYVGASRRQLARSRKRRISVISALTALAVGSLGLAVAANVSRNNAQRATLQAQAGDLAARSANATDPYTAALLALESGSWTDSPELQSRIAWRRAVGELGRQPLLRAGRPITTTPTSSMRWNPSGTMVALGATDGTLRLFDASTRKQVGVTMRSGHGATTSLDWSPSGDAIVTNNQDQSVLVFDAATQTERKLLADPVGGVPAWHPSGKKIALAGPFETLVVVDAFTGRQVGKSMKAGQFPNSLAWNPAGTVLASTRNDGLFSLFDVANGRELGAAMSSGSGAASALAWNADGSEVAVANTGGKVRVFAVLPDPNDAAANGGAIVEIEDTVDVGGTTTALAWSPDNSVFAVGTFDGSVHIVDASGPPEGGFVIGDPITTGRGTVVDLSWNNDGTLLAAANADGTVQFFDGKVRISRSRDIRSGEEATLGVAFVENGSLLATGNADGTLLLHDVKSGRTLDGTRMVTNESPAAVAWSSAGTAAFVNSDDGSVRFFTPQSRRISRSIPIRDDGATAFSWNSSGSRLAVAARDGRLHVLDAATGLAVGKPVLVDGGGVNWLAWNPVNSVIATANMDGTVRLFDSNSGKFEPPVSVAGDPIEFVGWNADGKAFAASIDGRVTRFDATTRRPIRSPFVVARGTMDLSWNPSGTLVATRGDDTNVRLIDGLTGQALGEPLSTGSLDPSLADPESRAATPPGVVIPIYGLAWNDSGTALAAALGDGQVHLFFAWNESSACRYLASLLSEEEMDASVAIGGSRSKCAHGGVRDRPPIPVLDAPLP